MNIEKVVWDRNLLSIDLGDEKIEGECCIPYHPYKFSKKVENYTIYSGYIIARSKKPEIWDGSGILSALCRCSFDYKLFAETTKDDKLYWQEDGELLYENSFVGERDNIYLPVPIHLGIRIFKKSEDILRVVLYYFEEIRVEKYEFKLKNKEVV